MIILTNATNFEIDTEFWKVKKSETHLPSKTDTAVQQAGYGGVGILLEINSQFYSHHELEITIYKNNSAYSYKTNVSSNNTCVLIPQGGELNDYSIVIEPKRIDLDTHRGQQNSSIEGSSDRDI